MNEQSIVDLGAKTIWLSIQMASPALFAALIVGLIVSILQAATQINEQTLVFIPKTLAMLAAMIICGPWIIQKMMEFTITLFKEIPSIVQ
jgi:flagellar biosynthetic protein FliQ